MINGAPGARSDAQIFTRVRALSVAAGCANLSELAKKLHFIKTIGAWIRRQLGRHQREIESRCRGNLCGQFNGTGITREVS